MQSDTSSWQSLFQEPWKSVRGKRARWEESEAETLGRAFLAALPGQTKNAILGGTLKVGSLFTFQSEQRAKRPCVVACKADIIANACWIRVVAKMFPHKTPSAYFLCDALLYANALLNGLLFSMQGECITGAPLVTRGVGEGGRLSKLLAHVRVLHSHSSRSYCLANRITINSLNLDNKHSLNTSKNNNLNATTARFEILRFIFSQAGHFQTSPRPNIKYPKLKD